MSAEPDRSVDPSDSGKQMTELPEAQAGFHRPSVHTLLFWHLRMSDSVPKGGPIIVRRIKSPGVGLLFPPGHVSGSPPARSEADFPNRALPRNGASGRRCSAPALPRIPAQRYCVFRRKPDTNPIRSRTAFRFKADSIPSKPARPGAIQGQSRSWHEGACVNSENRPLS